MTSEQIERIEAMETILDRAKAIVLKMNETLTDYAEIQDQIAELDAYYGSEEWRQDLKDDEEGRLPADLKRGVLSEDAVYDLITDNRDLMNDLRNVAQNHLSE